MPKIADPTIVTDFSLLIAIRLLFASFLLLFLPGWLCSLMFIRQRISWVLRASIAVALSIALTTLWATPILIAKAPLGWLLGIVAGFDVIAAGYVFWLYCRRAATGREDGENAIQVKAGPLLLGIFIVASAVVLVIFALPLERVNTPGDFWSYLAFVRKWATFGPRPTVTVTTGAPEIPGTSFRYLFGGWLLVQSLLSATSGVDPVDLCNWWVPSLLMMASYAGFYGLALTLFRNQNVAILSTLVQALHLFVQPFYLRGYLDQLGTVFFWRINEDKFLATFLLLPVATVLMVRFLRAKSKGDFYSFILLSVGLALLHPLGLICEGLTLGLFAGLHFLMTRRREVFLRLVYVFLPLVLLLAIPLTQKTAFDSAATFQDQKAQALLSYSLDTPEAREQLNNLYRERIQLLDERGTRYITHPRMVLQSPITFVGLLLIPFLLFYLRREIGAQYLFSNAVGLLFILFNPLLTPLLGRLVTPWMLWRFIYLLPSEMILGFLLERSATLVRRAFAKRAPQRAALMASFVPVAYLLVGSALLVSRHMLAWPDVYPGGKDPLFNEARRDLLLQMRRIITQPSLIMCDSRDRVSYLLPGFVQHAFVPAWREQSLFPTSQEDVLRFYTSDALDKATWDVLVRHNARYLVAARGWLNNDIWATPLLTPLYANNFYALFQVTQASSDHPFIQGNSFFRNRKWKEALEAYKQAKSEYQLAAQLRMAQVQMKRGYLSDARTLLNELVSLYPGNPWPRFYLGQVEESAGLPKTAVERYMEAAQLSAADSFFPPTIKRSLAEIEKRGASLLSMAPSAKEEWRRWGAAAALRSDISALPLDLLRIGWYADGRIASSGPKTTAEYAHTILVRPGLYPPNWNVVEDAIKRHIGAIWLVGMWPESPSGGGRAPDEYAKIYNEVYGFIKARDPSARVVVGGIMEPTPLRLQWLNKVLQAYKERFSENLPADGWHISVFILPEERGKPGAGIPVGIAGEVGERYGIADSANPELFKQLVIGFRRWMAEQGQQRRPLIISAYGVRYSSESLGGGDARAGDARLRSFMQDTFEYLRTAQDRGLGYPADQYRLVQRWLWYSLNDVPFNEATGRGSNGTLFAQPKGREPELTVFGSAFLDYMVRLQR